MASIRATVQHGLGVAELSAMSRAGLDRSLLHAAELVVAIPRDEGLVFGAHQRACEVSGGALPGSSIHRRGSGGGEAAVGTGTVWLQLALAQSSALLPCPPDRLINRHVRPLLRAITMLGVIAHYFERDWVSGGSGGGRRPVASVSFAHDGSTGRAYVEAIVAVSTPFAVRTRASNMGKEPATLAELGMRADPALLADAIAASYEGAYGAATGALSVTPSGAADRGDLATEPPWAAVRAEAIGVVGAGRDRAGRLRLGGELMVSRDALARLEGALATLPPAADAEAVGALVDATLGAPGVALFGVRSLRSIRDVIVEALAGEPVS